jgi:hypothetical protein
MKNFSSITVRLMGFFHCKIRTKISCFFLKSYLGNPTSFSLFNPSKLSYSLQSKFVCCFAICSILPMRCLSKIAKSIISFVSIYMIYLIFAIQSSHAYPSKPVSGIRFPVNLYVNIFFIFVGISSHISNFNFSTIFFPSKDAIIWVVRKDVVEVGSVHDPLFRDWIGKSRGIL